MMSDGGQSEHHSETRPDASISARKKSDGARNYGYLYI